MEVVYYFDKELGYCPIKNYLKKFILSSGNENRTEENKRLLATIRNKIDYHLIEREGQIDPPRVKKLSGYDFLEIRSRRNAKTVIRILFARHINKIVLLNIFEKSDYYKTKQEKKEVEINLEITNYYWNKFKINPNYYEEYK